MIKDYITPAERLNFKGQSWLQRKRLKRGLSTVSTIGKMSLIKKMHSLRKISSNPDRYLQVSIWPLSL